MRRFACAVWSRGVERGRAWTDSYAKWSRAPLAPCTKSEAATLNDLETSPYPLVYPLVRSHEASAAVAPSSSNRDPDTRARAHWHAERGPHDELAERPHVAHGLRRRTLSQRHRSRAISARVLHDWARQLVLRWRSWSSRACGALAIGKLELVQDNPLHDGGLGRPRRHDRRRIAGCAARPHRCGRFRRRTQRSRRGRRGSLTCGCFSPRCVRERVLDRKERRARPSGQRAAVVAAGRLRSFGRSVRLRARPDPDADFPRDIITKLAAADSVFGVEGGAGSSLRSEQKRTLHVRGIATLRADGLTETRVQLFKPIGSNFRFLCDLDQPQWQAGALRRRSNISRPASLSATSRRSAATRRS